MTFELGFVGELSIVSIQHSLIILFELCLQNKINLYFHTNIAQQVIFDLKIIGLKKIP